jgi:hypothetical protein
MLLETCQLLYTAHWVLAYSELLACRSPHALSRTQKLLAPPASLADAPRAKSTGQVYRPCHVSHPCAVWTRQTYGNYKWLARLGKELAREFRYRFGHEHSCEEHVRWLYKNPPPTILRFPRRGFAVAMDDQYKICGDPIRCYRHYYKTSKAERGLIKYTGRHVPHWL